MWCALGVRSGAWLLALYTSGPQSACTRSRYWHAITLSDTVNAAQTGGAKSGDADVLGALAWCSHVVVVALGFAHIGRFGVSQRVEGPSSVGLRRRTDYPIFALLALLTLCECGTWLGCCAHDPLGATTRAEVDAPLLMLGWVTVGGTHQNVRFNRRWLKGEGWTVTGVAAAVQHVQQVALPVSFPVVDIVAVGPVCARYYNGDFPLIRGPRVN